LVIRAGKAASEAEKLQGRTKVFAYDVLRLIRRLPRTAEASMIGRQLMRSATSVAANYRAACRSRSRAEFTAKVGIVLEEADESMFWLEAIEELGISREPQLSSLIGESHELVSIFFASQRTARRRAPNHQSSILNPQS
jgi:four helix bundle protein